MIKIWGWGKQRDEEGPEGTTHHPWDHGLVDYE